MISKRLGVAAPLLFLLLAATVSAAQTGNRPSTAVAPSPATVPAVSTTPPASTSLTNPACPGGACDFQQPRITIATPAPAPAPWPLQERIAWAANLLLVVTAYVGVLIALAALRKIERQSRYAETTAQAAADSAKAALLLAETQAQTLRPWLLVSAFPAPGLLDGFNIVAANRGRTPARILALADETVIAKDESQLPAEPAYRGEPHSPQPPILLLPGESVTIRGFRREDVKAVCESEEQFRRVEEWEAKIYLYGKVAYAALTAPEDAPACETSWCCWYIHGRQKSGLVLAGPRSYSRHS